MRKVISTKDKKKLEKLKKVIGKKRKRITYDSFISLPQKLGYFPYEDPQRYLSLVPKIRQFILSKLKERPYEEEELISKLRKYNPDFSTAWARIDSEIEDFGDNSEECRNALKSMTEGIEVRSSGNKTYWGLTSRLDRI